MGFYGNLSKNEDTNIIAIINLPEDIVVEAPVLRSNQMIISVDGDGKTNRGYANDPYFKIHKSSNGSVINIEETARVYFNRAEYVKPHGNVQYNNWKLNSSERKIADKLIGDNWIAMIEAANKVINYLKDEDKLLPLTLEKPDYTQLR